jgi:hypothetical protein
MTEICLIATDSGGAKLALAIGISSFLGSEAWRGSAEKEPNTVARKKRLVKTEYAVPRKPVTIPDVHMSASSKKLPPAFQSKALRIDAALSAYAEELLLLKKKQRAVMEDFLGRIEEVKIEETRKRLQSL